MCLEINVKTNIMIHNILGDKYVFGLKHFNMSDDMKSLESSFIDNITYHIQEIGQGLRLLAPNSDQDIYTHTYVQEYESSAILRKNVLLRIPGISRNLGMHFNYIEENSNIIDTIYNYIHNYVMNDTNYPCLIVCAKKYDIQAVGENNTMVASPLLVPNLYMFNKYIDQLADINNYSGTLKINSIKELYKHKYKELCKCVLKLM